MGMQCAHKLRFRKNFKKIDDVMEVPNLIEIQQKSFENFLQQNIIPDDRKEIGLQGVFKSVFPIHNYNNTSSIEFVSYKMGEPKYNLEECRQKQLTYA